LSEYFENQRQFKMNGEDSFTPEMMIKILGRVSEDFKYSTLN